MMPPVPLKN